MAEPATPKPQREHIFPATKLTEMVMQWKTAVAEKREAEAMRLLTEIVVDSQEMLRRFAVHEGFAKTVDIGILLGSANSKIMRWITGWEPSRGSLFKWFNACAKNTWLSEVNKENNFRKRYHVTGDDLEKFFGAEEHAVTTSEALKETNARVTQITSRWGNFQEIGTLGYILRCLQEGVDDKDAVVRGATYAWGCDSQLVKFFYTWCLFELRAQWADKVRIPFTEQDVIRAAHSYTYLPDLLNIISFDQFKRMVTIMGGARLKIPTLAQVAKLREHVAIHKQIEATDMTPDEISAIAKQRKRSMKSAEEIFEQMTATMNEDRQGDHAIFDDDSAHESDAHEDPTDHDDHG